MVKNSESKEKINKVEPEVLEEPKVAEPEPIAAPFSNTYIPLFPAIIVGIILALAYPSTVYIQGVMQKAREENQLELITALKEEVRQEVAAQIRPDTQPDGDLQGAFIAVAKKLKSMQEDLSSITSRVHTLEENTMEKSALTQALSKMDTNITALNNRVVAIAEGTPVKKDNEKR